VRAEQWCLGGGGPNGGEYRNSRRTMADDHTSVACWKLFYGVRRGTMEHVFSSCAGAASG